MWFGRDPDAARALEEDAHAKLADGDVDGALAAAERLLQMGWSGGFEIKALALQTRGDLDGAIATLEEAVRVAPAAWLLWQLLGNLRSDAGRLDAAVEALDAALACDGASESSVRFNRAIVQHRRGEPGAALDDLEPILALPRPPAFAEDALSLAARCLAELGRADDGLTLVTSARDVCAPDDPRRPRLEAERAVALDRAAQDPDDALDAALHAGVITADLLALLRRRRPPACEAPRRLHLVVQGELTAPGVAGVMRWVEVVADDEAQALALAVAILPEPARASAALEQLQVVEPSTDAEPGVHAASGLVYYGDE